MVYKIQLSIQAKQDYTKIISYLKNDLMEANIAEKYANLINNEIYSLKDNPQNKMNPLSSTFKKRLGNGS